MANNLIRFAPFGLLSYLRVLYQRYRGVKIGANVAILRDVKIDTYDKVVIGNDVTLCMGVRILTHDASANRLLYPLSEQKGKSMRGNVMIGDRCFIGERAFILPNVTLGKEVIVGAGSIVTRSFPDGVVIAGNPAKIIKTTSQFLDNRRKISKVVA